MSSILVVEYDQQHRVRMRQVLESRGYQVEEAGDGYEALACIERGRLALVVLDLSLPKVNGLEIIIYLQAHSPSLRILAICANLIEGIDTCRAAMGLGAHDALAKPFRLEEFLQRVEALLCNM
jgi:DNA-binding response OmpR family regulator